MSRYSDGFVAVKVENTRLSRGSALAAASSPFICWPSTVASCPSSASSWYSKPPVVDRPMIGGRLNGNTGRRAHLLHRAEHPPDQRLGPLGGRGAVGERLELQEQECRVALLRAVQQRVADDRERVLHARQRLADRLDLADPSRWCARRRRRPAAGRPRRSRPGPPPAGSRSACAATARRCRRRTPAPAAPRRRRRAPAGSRSRRSRRARSRCCA